MAASPSFVDVPETIVTNFNPGTGASQTVFQAGPKGARIYGGWVTQTDTSTGTVQAYIGDVLTENSLGFVDYRPNSIARRAIFNDIRFTNTTNSTITRQSGSFINDGWLIRDFVFTDCCNGTPGNQVIQQITSAVAAGTLTFTGANFAGADTAPGGAVRLIRVQELVAVALVSGAGTVAGTVPVVLFSSSTMTGLPSLPDTAFYLRPWQCLVVKCPTVAAGKQMCVYIMGGQC